MDSPFEVLAVLDWYDGVVTGLVRLRESLFLASLIAWSPDERQKVYALLELTGAEVAEIRAIERKSRDDQQSALRAIVDGLDGNVIVIGVDGSNDIVREVFVPIARVRQQLLGDVEAGLAPDRATWLNQLF